MAYPTIGPLLAALVAQAPPSPPAAEAGDASMQFGLLAMATGLVGAIGTKIITPLVVPAIQGYWEDRKHKREVDAKAKALEEERKALDMVNDLDYANRKIELQAKELAQYKSLADLNQARIEALEARLKELESSVSSPPVAPASVPPPEPKPS